MTDELKSVRILHLEDSSLDSELVEKALGRASIHASFRRAPSRRDFFRALEEANYDLILADYELPDFDGLSALRHIRHFSPDLPFVFVSGVLGEDIAIDTLKNGATDYVLKRNLERLAPAVARALQEREDRLKRRAAEDALEETEHRFEAMADAAPVLIWVTGPSKECEFFNKPWLAFTGRSLEEELRCGWYDLIHPDDLARWTELFHKQFERREPFTTEVRVRRGTDGDYRWLVINGSPRFSASGDFLGMIGSSIDLTDLKRTEERLRHTAKLESLGILAGGIAHDFNNLLTAIIGHTHLLLEELPEGSASSKLADNILYASDAAAKLTHQMLAYSGRGHFVIELIDISQFVSANRALINASVSKRVLLEYGLHDALPQIRGDAGQIRQIVMNLIINASEASDFEGGMVRVRTYRQESNGNVEGNLTGETLPSGVYVVFEVSDNGHGMDEATQARIFDPFFTTKFTGRGLGLAAVLGIVRGHKAAIQLRSSPGHGSMFTVLFPAVQ